MKPSGLRFSLRFLFVILSLLGVALAVAPWNAAWMASCCFSVFLMAQCFSIVGAISRKGAARVFWIGFTVFGFGYGLSAFTTDRSRPYWPFGGFSASTNTSEHAPAGPALLADSVLQSMGPRPRVGDEVTAQWQSGGYYIATVKEIRNGRLFVVWKDGSPASWVNWNQIAMRNLHGRVAAQSVLAVLIALLGAVVCQAVFGTRREDTTVESREVSPADASSPD